MHNQQEKQLMDQLKKMPDIIDDTDKDELYKQICIRLSREETSRRKRKTKYIIPLLATAAVLFFLISLPLLLNSGLNQTTSFDESSDDQADILMNEESSSIVSDSEERIEERGDEAEIVTEAENYITTFEESRVVGVVDSDSQIMNLAVYDDQLQYAIPISIILPKDKALEDYYNEFGNILASENIKPDDYLLEGLNFQLDFTNNEVLVNIPEDFTIGDGTARAEIFQQLIEEMFGPYGFERAVFEPIENKGVQLGMFGILTEHVMSKNRYASYMIYKEQYFVPISHEMTTTLNTAIEALKIDIPAFNITSTVPENVSFQIDDSNSDLILIYIGEGNIDSSQITMTTIESILLTAKSYGYEQVIFQNMPVANVGIYHFSEALKVPIGVNPIDHTN